MSLPQEQRRNQYIADGSQTVFIYSFYIEAPGDLLVQLKIGDNLPITVVNYSVQGVGEVGGGTITFDEAPEDQAIVTIISAYPYEYDFDFSAPRSFSGANLDAAFTNATIQTQQLVTILQQTALKYPITDYVTADESPEGIDQTLIPILGENQIWVGGASGAVTAVTYEENPDTSLLRSQLANDEFGTDGSRIVGYYDASPGGLEATTVHAMLDNTEDQIIAIQEDIADIIAGAIYPVGFHQWNEFNTAQSGWLLYQQGTIGSAISGASVLASATAQRLFTTYWTNYNNTQCPVSGGRGASAAADWAANKTLTLPVKYGSPNIIANSNYTVSATPNSPANQLLVTSSSYYQTGDIVQIAAQSGGTLPSGISALTNYYVIIIDATHIALATSSLNAHTGTAITFSGGTGNVNVSLSVGSWSQAQVQGRQYASIGVSNLPKFSIQTKTVAGTGAGDAPQPNLSNAVANDLGWNGVIQPNLENDPTLGDMPNMVSAAFGTQSPGFGGYLFIKL